MTVIAQSDQAILDNPNSPLKMRSFLVMSFYYFVLQVQISADVTCNLHFIHLGLVQLC